MLLYYRGLYICGHSAGGQLCAMVLSSDWSKVRDGRVPEIKGNVNFIDPFDPLNHMDWGFYSNVSSSRLSVFQERI